MFTTSNDQMASSNSVAQSPYTDFICSKLRLILVSGRYKMKKTVEITSHSVFMTTALK